MVSTSLDLWTQRAKEVPIESEALRRGIPIRGSNYSGPCPVCGGTDRFWVDARKQIFQCRKCDVGGDVIQLVRFIDGVGFVEALEILTDEQAERPIAPKPPPDETEEARAAKQQQKAKWLWDHRRQAAGTIVEEYARTARGILIPLPPTIGFLPAYKTEYHPAMIAAYGVPDEVEPGCLSTIRSAASVQLTLLTPDGLGKAEAQSQKFTVGSPSDLPIVLAPPNDLGGLAITEGIEDGLSVLAATGLGVWVAGSHVRMPAIAALVPGHVESCTICAHPDEEAQLSAERAGNVLIEKGVEVYIEGTDQWQTRRT